MKEKNKCKETEEKKKNYKKSKETDKNEKGN